MMRLLWIGLLLISSKSFGQYTDNQLYGKWTLFRVIDNLTGQEIEPPKPHSKFEYYVIFRQDSIMTFNLEVNKCKNTFYLPDTNQIAFRYYDECTEICCDRDFSSKLIYQDCFAYVIKSSQVLVLFSEDFTYYFTRSEEAE